MLFAYYFQTKIGFGFGLASYLKTIPESALRGHPIIRPLPPNLGFGVRVWEGLSGRCSSGLTLERYSQLWLPSRSGLSIETRRRYGCLRMVFPGVPLFRAPIWCLSGGWRHTRGREHCRGEPGCSLSGGYAPDSAKAEGRSIVDEPGEC